MLRVMIAEDEDMIRKGLVYTTDWLSMDCVVVAEAANGQEGLEKILKYKPDVVIADICMPFLDGIEMIKKASEQVRFKSILLTSYAEFDYARRAIEAKVCEYLLKPVDEHKFAEVMQRAMWQLEREKEEMSLLIKADGSYMEVLAKNILYAENEARKIVLHTKNMPESSYTFYEKMEVLEKRLGEGFFRSHRGFLVNLREVYKYDATTIQMKNGDKVYLAKQKYNDFVTAYMKYLRSAG